MPLANAYALDTCVVCGHALPPSPYRGRPRKYCTKPCRAKAFRATDDHRTYLRPLGPLPHPEGVLALARAVCERAVAGKARSVDPLWVEILRAATVTGMD